MQRCKHKKRCPPKPQTLNSPPTFNSPRRPSSTLRVEFCPEESARCIISSTWQAWVSVWKVGLLKNPSLRRRKRRCVVQRWPGNIRGNVFGERERASGNPGRCVFICIFFFFFFAKTARRVCRCLLQDTSGRPGPDCGIVGWLVAYKQHLRGLVLHLGGVTHRLQSLASHWGTSGSGRSCGRKTDEPPAAWDTLGARVNFFLVSSFISPFGSLIFRPSTPGPPRLRPSPILTALSGSTLSYKSTRSSFAVETKLAELSHVLLKTRDLF